MVKILVADSIREFCSAVADTLGDRYTVLTCCDGKTALKMISAEQPDILWLDLMLPGMDGLTILQAAALAGVFPKVIACVRHVSDQLQDALRDYPISGLLQKPCELSASTMRIDALAAAVIREKGIEVNKEDHLIRQTLLLLGLSGKRCGHKCLYSAVRLKVSDPQGQITKTLYPGVAAECGGSAQSVEKAIRGVLTSAWEKRADYIWKLYFPEDLEKCPSNGMFLDRIAERIAAALSMKENKEPPASL